MEKIHRHFLSGLLSCSEHIRKSTNCRLPKIEEIHEMEIFQENRKDFFFKKRRVGWRNIGLSTMNELQTTHTISWTRFSVMLFSCRSSTSSALIRASRLVTNKQRICTVVPNGNHQHSTTHYAVGRLHIRPILSCDRRDRQRRPQKIFTYGKGCWRQVYLLNVALWSILFVCCSFTS